MAGEQQYQIRSLLPNYRRLAIAEARFVLHQAYFTLSLHLDLRFLHIPRNIYSLEQMIHAKMMAYKAKYMHEENFFVGQMLMQEPVTLARRSTVFNRTDMTPTQIIKAESCRRSRYNRKVRRAVKKHQHKFIKMNLMKSAMLLRSIHQFTAVAEYRLMQAGYDPKYFLQMRFALGLNQNIDDLLALPEKLK